MYWSIFMMMGYYKSMIYKRILVCLAYAFACVGSATSSETENIYWPFPEIFTEAALPQ